MSSGEWVYRLGQVAADLSAAASLDALIDTIVNETVAWVGARTINVFLVDAEHENLLLAGSSVDDDSINAPWASFPIGAALPAAEALRNRVPLTASGRTELELRYPGLGILGTEEVTLTCLPLLAGDRDIGSSAPPSPADGTRMPFSWNCC